jgi:hypothetical protein
MDFDQFLNRLQDTPIAIAIREHEILFPWIESFHVLAIVLVVGTISIVDLRLLGLASRNRAVTILMRETLPCTWAAFVVAVTADAQTAPKKQPTIVNPPPTAQDYADLAKLPDWSGVWNPKITDQDRQARVPIRRRGMKTSPRKSRRCGPRRRPAVRN